MYFFRFLFIIISATTLTSCASSKIKSNQDKCSNYDYVKFCNIDGVGNDRIIDKIRKKETKPPKGYHRDEELSKKWNEILALVNQGELQYNQHLEDLKSSPIATLTRKKGLTEVKIRRIGNAAFMRDIINRNNRIKEIDYLPETITNELRIYQLCETIFVNGKPFSCQSPRQGALIQDQFIKDWKEYKDFYSDMFYIEESIKDVKEKITPIYLNGDRQAFITKKTAPPHVDELGNLYLSSKTKKEDIRLIMLHEGVHIMDKNLNPVIWNYSKKIFGSKKFIQRNFSTLMRNSKYYDAPIDIFKGDDSVVFSAEKETIIDAKVLNLISDNHEKCLHYLNILKTNIVHSFQEKRISFVEKACDAIEEKKYNFNKILKNLNEFIKYRYSDSSLSLLESRLPDYRTNTDIQNKLTSGIIDQMYLIGSDRKLFESFLSSIMKENEHTIQKR